jgi:Na+-transporting NADH:ubiquinone oxidoreductase subunit NqrB
MRILSGGHEDAIPVPELPRLPLPTESWPGRGSSNMTAHSLTIGRSSYPVVLPSLRDPRLHVASVIISIHVLGQVALNFQVSVPQILAAILTCAVIEMAITFRQTRSFVWPASAMLTGSGVALILRVVGTPVGDHWTTYAWWMFAGIAGLSLLSKYVIRYHGSHVFNPSNIGLVVAFVVLGSSRIEPLDFWWGPLDAWMILAYVIIVGGGVLITRRLHLLVLAATFWVTFAIGTGLLAASGHCMTARWAFAPVCGSDYFRVIVTSPEVLIFLLFMITDPKTAPSGRVARVAFGVLVAIASVLLMAPQTNEFGAKVGLLAGLVVMCAVRPLLDRILPAPKTAADNVRRYAAQWVAGGSPGAGLARAVGRVAIAVAAVLVVGTGIVLAGTPARGLVLPDTAEILARVPVDVDPSTLPAITVSQDVADWDHTIAGAGMQEVVLTLAQNLELENQALLRRDPSILPAVDHGDRLVEMQHRVQDAAASGTTVIDHYQFDSIDVQLLVPFGMQTGLSLGLNGHGTMIEETYDASGNLQDRRSSPFDLTFAMRRATGDRWLNVAVRPIDGGG